MLPSGVCHKSGKEDEEVEDIKEGDRSDFDGTSPATQVGGEDCNPMMF